MWLDSNKTRDGWLLREMPRINGGFPLADNGDYYDAAKQSIAMGRFDFAKTLFYQGGYLGSYAQIEKDCKDFLDDESCRFPEGSRVIKSDFLMPNASKSGFPITYNQFKFPVKYVFKGNPDRIKVDMNRGLIARLPDALLRFICYIGGKVVFYDGVMSDFPGFESNKDALAGCGWRNKFHPDGRPIVNDDLGGWYVDISKTAFVGIGDSYLQESLRWTSLHEVSHLIDYAAGEKLLGKMIHDTDEMVSASLERTDNRQPDMTDIEHRVELTAHAISAFYLHIDTRRQLKQTYPGVFDLLHDFDDKVAKWNSSKPRKSEKQK
ncbi:hypothetical protein HYU13_00360 [Candidatus Woesearchaeota archaeon]|nr:hypothetical protein [Candidatus Woesearchaeota archaeon]